MVVRSACLKDYLNEGMKIWAKDASELAYQLEITCNDHTKPKLYE